jgi:hypothetical protein
MIGRTFQEHLLNLWKVFHPFQEACLKLNSEKCQHLQKQVRYLEHTMSPQEDESHKGMADQP